MKELILHVGHSKCASSTLQHFLSMNFSENAVSSNSTNYVYAAITKAGGVITGKKIKTGALNSPYKYINSSLDFSDTKALHKSITNLHQSTPSNCSVILSNEGLSNPRSVTPEMISTFNSFNAPIKIFMVCRPPVDWFNASWWQWGCWTGLTVNEWFDRHGNIDMLSNASQWKGLSNLQDLKIVDISQDPVQSFLRFLDLPYMKSESSVNISSSADLLRFLLRNKKRFNRTEHNPYAEFLFNSILKRKTKNPPFVADKKIADRIIQRNITNNKNLLIQLSENTNYLSDDTIDKYTIGNYYTDVPTFDLNTFLNEPYSNDFLIDLAEKSIGH